MDNSTAITTTRPAIRTPKSRSFLWFRWIRRVLYGLTIFVAWKLAWRWYEMHKATKEYEKAAAELDKSDPGWRWEEIQASREELPPKENAGTHVLAAVKLIPRGWASAATRDPMNPPAPPAADVPTLLDRLVDAEPNQQLDEGLLANIRDELRLVAEPLAEARKLADTPKGRYTITLAQNPLNSLLPHLDGVRSVAALLRLDAAVRAQAEGTDRACESVLASINAGRSIGDDPMLISPMVRVAAVTSALVDLERVLAQGELSPALLQRVSRLLEQEERDVPGALIAALRGDRAISAIIFERMATGELDPPHRRMSPVAVMDRIKEWQSRPSVQAARARSLRYTTRLLELSRLPRAERAAALQQLQADLRAKDNDPAATFAVLTAEATGKVFTAGDRHIANLRCVRAALAAERYRLAHQGRWPTRIDQLVPEFLEAVPIDPFTDNPLEIEEQDGVLIISSVGSDGLADDALVNPRRLKPPDPAIRSRLWKPESRGLPSD
jgi:hypothetical protein